MNALCLTYGTLVVFFDPWPAILSECLVKTSDLYKNCLICLELPCQASDKDYSHLHLMFRAFGNLTYRLIAPTARR